MEGQTKGQPRILPGHVNHAFTCHRTPSSFLRRMSIFLLFLGLGVVPLGGGVVDGAPSPGVHSCSHVFIVSAYLNACKGKRSHDQKLVGQQSAPLDEKEVLEVVFNTLSLYEDWTQHHPKEEDSSPNNGNAIKKTRTTPTKDHNNLQRGARRTRKAVSNLPGSERHDETDNDPTQNDVEEVIRDDLLLSPKSSPSPSISPPDAKMWNWMLAEMAKLREGPGGRLRRDPDAVMRAVLACCNGGCDSKHFNCN